MKYPKADSFKAGDKVQATTRDPYMRREGLGTVTGVVTVVYEGIVQVEYAADRRFEYLPDYNYGCVVTPLDA